MELICWLENQRILKNKSKFIWELDHNWNRRTWTKKKNIWEGSKPSVTLGPETPEFFHFLVFLAPHSIWSCTSHFSYEKLNFSQSHITQKLILDPPSILYKYPSPISVQNTSDFKSKTKISKKKKKTKIPLSPSIPIL